MRLKNRKFVKVICSKCKREHEVLNSTNSKYKCTDCYFADMQKSTKASEEDYNAMYTI